MLIAFIVVVGLLTYAWIVYPLVMLLLGKCVGRRSLAVSSGGRLPSVAILLSAHNEESVILKRLENLLGLDYPADCLHVFVGVDGGSDRTAEIVVEWAKSHANVHVVVSASNHGKTAMLKRLRDQLLGESLKVSLPSTTQQHNNPKTVAPLLIFTDANTMFSRDALRHLAAPFADSKVGGVCGRLIFQDEAGAETRENLYWRVETLLKTAESKLDSCLGANGAIYAIRQELFWDEMPDNTIIDDFVIGMKVCERGFKMVYKPEAMAHEQTPTRIADEWRRRVRIGAGAFQAMSLCRACLLPQYGRFAIFFWSHKILRWFTPHLMLLVVVAAMVNLVHGSRAGVASAAVILASGAVFIVLSIIGHLLGPSSRLKAFEYFLSMQAALFAGFLKYCRGGLKGTWDRTERG